MQDLQTPEWDIDGEYPGLESLALQQDRERVKILFHFQEFRCFIKEFVAKRFCFSICKLNNTTKSNRIFCFLPIDKMSVRV